MQKFSLNIWNQLGCGNVIAEGLVESLIQFVSQNPALFDKGNKNDKDNNFTDNV